MNLLLELHAVTDGKKSIYELKEIICSISDIVDYIHIREKNKSPSEIVQLVEQVVQMGVRKEKLVINDRLDIALLTGVCNVHLPTTGLPIRKVKSMFPEMRVGVSVHSLEEALHAEKGGADYCLFGNVFETNSKVGLAGKGTEALGEIVARLKIPVIGIGGITPDNMQKVFKQNAKGIAVMSYIFSSEHPVRAASLLKNSEEGRDEFETSY